MTPKHLRGGVWVCERPSHALPPPLFSCCVRIPQLITSYSSSPFMFPQYSLFSPLQSCTTLQCPIFVLLPVSTFYTNTARLNLPVLLTFLTTSADRLDAGPTRPPCCSKVPDRVSWPGSTPVSNNLVSALHTRLTPSVLAPWWLMQIQPIC